TRARILQLRLAAGKVERVREAAWADLAPIAATPLRQPLAAATIAAGDRLDVALTDRAASVHLDAELHAIANLEGFAVPSPSGVACAEIARGLIGARRAPCSPNDAAPREIGRPAD